MDEEEKKNGMKKTKQLCDGCHNDYYNQTREDGCWSFRTAKRVQKVRVGTWQDPPYVWQPVDTLDCYCPERGTTMLGRKDPRVVGSEAEAKRWIEARQSMKG